MRITTGKFRNNPNDPLLPPVTSSQLSIANMPDDMGISHLINIFKLVWVQSEFYVVVTYSLDW